jgi:hypothetical protein
MFHVISARLNRLARKIAALRDGQINEYAAWHGWTATQVSPGTWRYRDPRFDQLAARRTEATATGRTWAQAALADRIHGLDLTADDTMTGGGRDAC